MPVLPNPRTGSLSLFLCATLVPLAAFLVVNACIPPVMGSSLSVMAAPPWTQCMLSSCAPIPSRFSGSGSRGFAHSPGVSGPPLCLMAMYLGFSNFQ